MPPGRYTVRLTVDGEILERPIDVRLDPRVEIDDESLRQQTDFSLRCYFAYLEAQEMRDAIDTELETATGNRHGALAALRGDGEPGEPDVMYDYVVAAAAEDETVVDLQYKLLWVMYVLQEADARPTTAAKTAVMQLERSLGELLDRWEALRSH